MRLASGHAPDPFPALPDRAPPPRARAPGVTGDVRAFGSERLFASTDGVWANLHLLFSLSLVPFATAWVGGRERAPLPTALYGVVLLGCAASWLLLQAVTIRAQGAGSPLKRALDRDRKGRVSFLLYAIGIPASRLATPLADGCYAVVAALWLVPDRRVEAHLHERTIP